jgi:hypothetical protein
VKTVASPNLPEHEAEVAIKTEGVCDVTA